MEEDPAGVVGENSLLAAAEGGNQREQESDGEDEDAQGHRSVAGVDGEKYRHQKDCQQGEGLVGFDRQEVVCGVEGLGEGDEVEEDGGDGGGDGDMPPAGAVVQSCGQYRESGDAVEENRDSEPKERHTRVRAR